MQLVKTSFTFEDASTQDWNITGAQTVITRVTQTLADGTVQVIPAPAGNTQAITSVAETFGDGSVQSWNVAGTHTSVTDVTQTDDSGVVTHVAPTVGGPVADPVVSATFTLKSGLTQTIVLTPAVGLTDTEVDIVKSDGSVVKLAVPQA